MVMIHLIIASYYVMQWVGLDSRSSLIPTNDLLLRMIPLLFTTIWDALTMVVGSRLNSLGISTLTSFRPRRTRQFAGETSSTQNHHIESHG